MSQILDFLQTTMEPPEPFGWFHFIWIAITIVSTVFLVTTDNKKDSHLRVILFAYGIIALALELTKQFIWTYSHDAVTNQFIVDYQWYAAPFQLCTTPIYISLICSAIPDGKFRNALLSYMSFITIWGGIMTMLMPESCFTAMIEVNIHTMWLHCGGLVVSLYLLITRKIKATIYDFISAIIVFIALVSIAMALNIIIYKSGVLNGEVFNMFYISPYFISDLPVFSTIQTNAPYPIFLLSYISALSIGASIVFVIANIPTLVVRRTNSHGLIR